MMTEPQEANLDYRTFVGEAFASARAAQLSWSRLSIGQRLGTLRRTRELLAENAGALAAASAAPRERPIYEALSAEVLPLIEACRFLEKKAGTILAPRRYRASGPLRWLGHACSEVHREPFGVVVIIGPGNYPLLLPGVQLLQALSAGNAVILKPGVGGTRVMQLLQRLLLGAGVTPSLLTILPEEPDAARAAIEAMPDKLLFTGSASVGQIIQEQLASRLIPSTLELSGSDPVIVCVDADLNLVAKAIKFGLEFNAGATCMSPKRLFVDRSIATELEGRLAQIQFPRWKVANGRLWESIHRAVTAGAYFVAGGIAADGRLELPVVLGGVTPEAQVLSEDLFGPILSMVTVSDLREAILRANDSPYALSASVFSRDERKANEVAHELKVGTVTLNDLIIPTADPRLPFSGRQRSGFGVTRGAEGLLELTRPKVVTFSRGRGRRAFDPAVPGQAALLEAYARIVHSGEPRSWFAAARSLWRLLNKPEN